ncbi:hypothetical protein [Streptomyces griseoluteus]
MDVLLTLAICLVVGYGCLCGLLAEDEDAPRWLRWPLPIWNWIAHDWRRPKPRVQRPDYVKIAVLEYELFGIEPKPGTAAAAVVNMRRAVTQLRR